jgi:hypothetical protein
MAEQPCLPQVQACGMRVTRLAANGAPLVGVDSAVVTDSLVTLTATPVYTDGDEIEQKNACGVVCVNYRSADTFKRLDVSLPVCSPNPYLLELLSGGGILTDTDRIGWAAPALGPVVGDGVSIELWSLRIDNGALDADSPYGLWVLPRVNNLRIGEFAFGNNPLLPTLTGQAYENPNWALGGFDSWPTGVASDRVIQYAPTADAPPAAVCAYVPVAA